VITGGEARSRGTPAAVHQPLPLAPVAVGGRGERRHAPSLFWVFLKTGSVLFGSGYVLLAFLRADLVERLGWLTEAQLLDAIAVGQITPGPVFTTATFIGYVLAGPAGALVATAGIFLPAFVFVALSGPLIPRLRASPRASRLLDGVNVASLALMAVVTVELGRTAIVDLATAGIAVASAVLLVRFKINSTWLVLGGAALGWVMHAARGVSPATRPVRRVGRGGRGVGSIGALRHRDGQAGHALPQAVAERAPAVSGRRRRTGWWRWQARLGRARSRGRRVNARCRGLAR
jgi:chromate transport protein ChrA